jgi:hypothetical protein
VVITKISCISLLLLIILGFKAGIRVIRQVMSLATIILQNSEEKNFDYKSFENIDCNSANLFGFIDYISEKKGFL